jgi:hypothetical protein
LISIGFNLIQRKMDSHDKKESQLLHGFYLTEDDLINDAKHKFPFHTEIINSLNFCGQNILTNKNLAPMGRRIICSKIMRKYKNVKDVFNYLASTFRKNFEFFMAKCWTLHQSSLEMTFFK